MEVTNNNIINLNTMPTTWEQSPRQVSQDNAIQQQDSVRVSNFPQNATLLSDAEAETVLQETVHSITSDPYAAMHVHSGLDASRVAALIA